MVPTEMPLDEEVAYNASPGRLVKVIGYRLTSFWRVWHGPGAFLVMGTSPT